MSTPFLSGVVVGAAGAALLLVLVLLRAQGLDPDNLPYPTRGAHLLEVYVFWMCVLRWERRASARSRSGEPMLLLRPQVPAPPPPPTPRQIPRRPPAADDPTIFVP
jgi:hypothetical protein